MVFLGKRNADNCKVFPSDATAQIINWAMFVENRLSPENIWPILRLEKCACSYYQTLLINSYVFALVKVIQHHWQELSGPLLWLAEGCAQDWMGISWEWVQWHYVCKKDPEKELLLWLIYISVKIEWGSVENGHRLGSIFHWQGQYRWCFIHWKMASNEGDLFQQILWWQGWMGGAFWKRCKANIL